MPLLHLPSALIFDLVLLLPPRQMNLSPWTYLNSASHFHIKFCTATMSSDENTIVGKKRPGALHLGAKKNRASLLHVHITLNLTEYLGVSCGTDPLIHHGRHFGRTVHALCTISALINNGILRTGELAEQPDTTYSKEYIVSPIVR
jgi:hypothetical protein